MESTLVPNTKKLLNNQDQKYPLPLDQDVAVRSLTLIGNEYSKEMAFKLALTLVDCMAREMYSPDALYLAMRRAMSNRPDGILKSDWDAMIAKIAEYLDRNRKSNPVSGLF
jgi:hypothetical protein